MYHNMQGAMREMEKRIRMLKSAKELRYEEIDEFGKQLGRDMKNKGLTVTQLRKIYNIILSHRRNLLSHRHNFDKDRFRLLKPLLAYITAKNKAQELYNLLSNLIVKVNDEEDFERFYKLMESTLAYYTYYKEIEKSDRKGRSESSYEGWSEDDLR